MLVDSLRGIRRVMLSLLDSRIRAAFISFACLLYFVTVYMKSLRRFVCRSSRTAVRLLLHSMIEECVGLSNCWVFYFHKYDSKTTVFFADLGYIIVTSLFVNFLYRVRHKSFSSIVPTLLIRDAVIIGYQSIFVVVLDYFTPNLFLRFYLAVYRKVC